MLVGDKIIARMQEVERSVDERSNILLLIVFVSFVCINIAGDYTFDFDKEIIFRVG